MTPSLHSNIVDGRTNHSGMVKEHKIGQSAAKPPLGREEERSTTIPQGSTHKCVEAQGASLDFSDDIVSSAWQHAAA